MSALILKDLYIMKKYCRSVLLMVVIFWGASIFADSGNLFWTFFPVIVGSVTPATLLSYDEKFRWNQYCDTMPISRAAVVAEKYMLTAATVLLLTRRRCSPCRGRYPRRCMGKRVCENHGRFIDERDNKGARSEISSAGHNSIRVVRGWYRQP